MVAPIFKFRNVKIRLSTNSPTFIYGVVEYNGSQPDSTLADGVDVEEVSSVILTVQVSNMSGVSVPISAYIQNSESIAPPLGNTARTLVEDYPLIAKNAFDPLSGNLVMSANDQLWVTAGTASVCDVVVSILEIANATAT
jgi:hypothetical protein